MFSSTVGHWDGRRKGRGKDSGERHSTGTGTHSTLNPKHQKNLVRELREALSKSTCEPVLCDINPKPKTLRETLSKSTVFFLFLYLSLPLSLSRPSPHRPPVAVPFRRWPPPTCAPFRRTGRRLSRRVMSPISTPSFSEMMLSGYVFLRASIILPLSSGHSSICRLRLSHKYSSKFAVSKMLVLYCHGLLPDIAADSRPAVIGPGLTALNVTVVTLSTLLEHSRSSHVAEKPGGSRRRCRRSSTIFVI
jgi:hypothetical protein